MKNTKSPEFIYTSSINSYTNEDEFIIELFSLQEDEIMLTDDIEKKEIPDQVIHNFDELINFFESMDQEDVKEKQLELVGQN